MRTASVAGQGVAPVERAHPAAPRQQSAAFGPAAPRCPLFAAPAPARAAGSRLVAQVATKWAEDTHTVVEGFNESTGISVCSHFDSGNADVVDVSDPQNIKLRIHPDPYTEGEDREHYQWFYYRIAGVKNMPLKMNFVNAGGASYPDGWVGYQARASYDRKRWFTVPTTYDEASGTLTIQHTPDRDCCYYASFAPYTYEMHQQLIAAVQTDDRVKMKVLGQTHDGHDIELLRIGEPGEGKRNVWMLARQHPGESMGEWFVEGFLRRLLDRDEALARKVLGEAVFYVVPNMNPDGVWRGHLRTNADGYNLNREWVNPTAEDVPEVFYVKRKMDEVGVDLFIDVHGDEVVGHNFLIGNEGIPSWCDRLKALQDRFREAFHRNDPTFCTTDEVQADAPGAANLAIAARQVGERFKCLAFTIEMPFKDTEEFPDPECGWSSVRSQHFGASMLNPIADVLPHLARTQQAAAAQRMMLPCRRWYHGVGDERSL